MTLTTEIFGIKNCDTMKKALAFLDKHGVEYRFHNYKKDGADEALLRDAMAQHGVDVVINKRGTTWRNLDDAVKNTLAGDDAEENAVQVALANTSLIKRPILRHYGAIYIGFKDAFYKEIFNI